MLSALLAFLGSSTAGSILGGLFAIFNRRVDIEAKRLELEQERARWAHEALMRDKDFALAQIEAAGRKEVALIEGDASVESARMAALAAAHAADRVGSDEIQAAGNMRWMLVLASTFNRIIRPCATVILTTGALVINWLLIDRMTDGWASMTTQQQSDAGMQALAWITGQAAACLSYWFVARGSSAAGK